MAYLLLAVAVATYTFIVYLQPVLDVKYEVYKTEKTFELEKQQLKLQSQKYELMRKYPEMYKDQHNTVVEGFQYEVPQEEYYDDDDVEDWEWREAIENKKIGYKYEMGFKYDGKSY